MDGFGVFQSISRLFDIAEEIDKYPELLTVVYATSEPLWLSIGQLLVAIVAAFATIGLAIAAFRQIKQSNIAIDASKDQAANMAMQTEIFLAQLKLERESNTGMLSEISKQTRELIQQNALLKQQLELDRKRMQPHVAITEIGSHTKIIKIRNVSFDNLIVFAAYITSKEDLVANEASAAGNIYLNIEAVPPAEEEKHLKSYKVPFNGQLVLKIPSHVYSGSADIKDPQLVLSVAYSGTGLIRLACPIEINTSNSGFTFEVSELPCMFKTL